MADDKQPETCGAVLGTIYFGGSSRPITCGAAKGHSGLHVPGPVVKNPARLRKRLRARGKPGPAGKTPKPAP